MCVSLSVCLSVCLSVSVCVMCVACACVMYVCVCAYMFDVNAWYFSRGRERHCLQDCQGDWDPEEGHYYVLWGSWCVMSLSVCMCVRDCSMCDCACVHVWCVCVYLEICQHGQEWVWLRWFNAWCSWVVMWQHWPGNFHEFRLLLLKVGSTIRSWYGIRSVMQFLLRPGNEATSLCECVCVWLYVRACVMYVHVYMSRNMSVCEGVF